MGAADPALLLGMTTCFTVLPLPRFDFDNFFRDLGLARAIHHQSQRIDHIAGIASGRIHGGHACGVLGGYGFQQRMKNLDADILWQNALEKLTGRLLVNVIDGQGGKFGRGFIDRAGIGWTQTYALPFRGLNSLRMRSSCEGSSAICTSTSPMSLMGSRRSTTRRCAITDLNSLKRM